jgi:Ca2+/Na+ antiporter
MPRIGPLRDTMRSNRKARRELLTRGERAVGWLLAFLPTILVAGGIALLISGDGSAAYVLGIALLILALVVAAVPTSPLLRARVRKREARSGRN